MRKIQKDKSVFLLLSCMYPIYGITCRQIPHQFPSLIHLLFKRGNRGARPLEVEHDHRPVDAVLVGPLHVQHHPLGEILEERGVLKLARAFSIVRFRAAYKVRYVRRVQLPE